MTDDAMDAAETVASVLAQAFTLHEKSLGDTKAAFKKTLTRYGVDISDDESSKLFSFYDKDGMDVRSLIFSQPLHGFHPSSVHFLYALARMLPL